MNNERRVTICITMPKPLEWVLIVFEAFLNQVSGPGGFRFVKSSNGFTWSLNYLPPAEG